VTVKEGRKAFDVTARFLPVVAFDSVTNEKLNRQKAEGFVFIGLARFMGIEKPQRVVVTGLTPRRLRLRDGVVELSYVIPKEGIRRMNRPAIPDDNTHQHGGAANGREDVASDSAGRETDYREMIALIDASGRSSAGVFADAPGDPYEDIACVEEETVRLLEEIRRQVSTDAHLEPGQRSRLLADIDRSRKAFLAALRTELQILETAGK
jgi:hypothetical protein